MSEYMREQILTIIEKNSRIDLKRAGYYPWCGRSGYCQ